MLTSIPGRIGRIVRLPWLLFPAFLAGMLLVFITPPMQVADESTHVFRVCQLSQGDILAQRQGGHVGGDVAVGLQVFREKSAYSPRPENLFLPDGSRRGLGEGIRQLRAQLQRAPMRDQERVFVDFGRAAFYPPVGYAPQALGFFLARSAGCPVLGAVYAGRCLNLLAYFALVIAAVRWMPAQKMMLGLMAVLPMSIYQAASLSADAMTNGLAFCFIARILALAADEKGPPVGRVATARVALLVFLMALTKACWPLILLAFAVGPSRFPARRDHALWLLATLGVFLLTLGGWAWLNHGLMLQDDGGDLSPGRQWHAMLHNPAAFLQALWGAWTSGTLVTFYLVSWVGLFGIVNVPLPAWQVAGTLVWLGYLSVADPFAAPHARWRAPVRRVALGVGLGCVLFIFVLLYLAWCPVGSAEAIRGVQGRYFTAFAPLAGVVLLRFTPPSWARATAILLPVWMGGVWVGAIWTVLSAYWL